MALSQFCLWNCKCLWNIAIIIARQARTISALTWLNLSKEDFSEWVYSENWLRLNSDLIVRWCFNSYLLVLLISSWNHFAQRRSVQGLFWTFLTLLTHLNPCRFASQTTTNLLSNKDVDRKWLAQNNNSLLSNGLSTKFEPCK